MKIDFSKVSDEPTTYELIPEGLTLLKVVECEQTETSKGNEMWKFIYQDREEHKIYDNLVFTDKTLNRVKKTFSNLGLDVSGSFDYQPDDVVGLYMNAYVLIEDYEYNGKKGQRNTIDIWQSEKAKVSGGNSTVSASASSVKKPKSNIIDEEEKPF